MAEEAVEKQIVRDVREGLRMTKRRVLKDDGRYLIYYGFERVAVALPEPEQGEAPR